MPRLLHLALTVLTLYLTLADDDSLENHFKPTSRVVEFNFSHQSSPEPYTSVLVVSRTKPTSVTFQPDQSPDYVARAVVTRLSANGTERSRCSFPIGGNKDLEAVSMMLYSLEDDVEVFSMTKRMNTSEPTTDLFVVDMLTCGYTKAVVPIAIRDVPFPGTGFIVYRPKDSKFEVFSLGGRRDCGTHICKRVYDIDRKTLLRSVRFNWLDSDPDHRMRDEIFNVIPLDAGRYVGIQILQSNLAKVTHLTNRGNEINSGQFFTDSVRFIEISSARGNVSICYSTMRKQTELHCLAKRLNNETHVTASLDVGYNIESMTAVHLREADKIVLLTLGCPSMKECKRYRMQLLEWSDGVVKIVKHVDVDAKCLPKSESYLSLYQEKDHNSGACVYYKCDVEMGKLVVPAMFNRCFERQLDE